MKKIANFIVEKRNILMVTVIIIAGICAMLMPKVGVNTDMSKYLPDDSSMKIGMDIMEEEFPKAKEDYTIRVMFKDLADDEKAEMKSKLAGIEHVTSVDYQADSKDFNKDGYTKYILHTNCDYGTSEEVSIEHTLEKHFHQNDMKYKNDSGSSSGLPTWVAITAVTLLALILLIMSESWVEPFLFLIMIGIAIVINLGTNIILGSISQNTFSVAAVLQLALSMDYSIILSSRYRQELEKNPDKKEAMKAAVAGAFSSISSSSLTTVVGLLALVFMSFKIGFDMGVVLAKGVFISVLCVFLVLPGFIMLFSRLIEKTSKRAPDIPTGGIAKFCNKFRLPLTLCFIAIFGAAYVLQQRTDISFSNAGPDPITEIFPTHSTVVMLYENQDDEKVNAIADDLIKRDDVLSATTYTNSIAKQYPAAEMVHAMNSMSENSGNTEQNSGFTLDENLLNVLYFKYYGGEAGSITPGEFMRFMAEDVMTSESFSSYINDEMREHADTMKALSSPEKLRTPVTAAELSGVFGMEPADCQKLFLYYFMQQEGVEASPLTLSEFVRVLSGLPEDMQDADSKEQLGQLIFFADKEKVTAMIPVEEAAKYLGIDTETAKQLAAAKYGSETDTASVYDITDVLISNSAAAPEAAQKLSALKSIMDAAVADKKMDASALAAVMGMETEKAYQLMLFSDVAAADSKFKMSAEGFMQFLTNGVLTNEEMSSGFSEDDRNKINGLFEMMNAVLAEKEFTPEEMTALFSGMSKDFNKNTASLLFLYHDANISPDTTKTMSLEQLMNYLSDTFVNDEVFSSLIDEDTKSGIQQKAAELNEGVKQLRGDKYSRLILTVTVPEDGEEAEGFYSDLNDKCSDFSGEYHLIGSSAMNYEMSQSFDNELLQITLLTAIAIFVVVVITFRSAVVPAILVLLVQCGVYITVTTVGFQGYSINYIALLIVQCILMGSTIDYGILFSNYYRDARKHNDRLDALKLAYKGSIHTILTSGLIIVVVTAILGQCFGEPTAEEICKTLSIGAASAITLIIFILPGILSCLDRFTTHKDSK